jgi:translation elongation factor EF-Ts
MNIFEPFIRQVLTQGGFHPSQIDDEMVEETTHIFIDRFITVLTEKLSDDDKVIFLELIENNETLDAAMEFIRMKLGNYDEILEDTMDDFADEYLAGMKK